MQIGVGFFLMPDGVRGCCSVIMPGINRDVIREFHDDVIKRLVHLPGVSAGKVASSAAVDKDNIAGDHVFF